MAKSAVKLPCMLMLAMIATATGVAAQTAIPDLRGTWKGTSESIVLGAGNPHHFASGQEPELRSIPFTLTIDKQEGVASPELLHRRAPAPKWSP